MTVDVYTLAGLLVGATSVGCAVGAGVLVGVSLRLLRLRAEEAKRAAAGR
jgi:F0F1-type ATP synthase membrane subunit c/vacuolar-type H+-ATPase subunit K